MAGAELVKIDLPVAKKWQLCDDNAASSGGRGVRAALPARETPKSKLQTPGKPQAPGNKVRGRGTQTMWKSDFPGMKTRSTKSEIRNKFEDRMTEVGRGNGRISRQILAG